MSGHSHWKQVKHKKAASDAKKGKAFSKLLNAIAVAARGEPNPDFNPRLRTAIEKARAANVPGDNIARAIARASEKKNGLEEVTIETYGPGGTAIIISVITDNKNRTIQELKTMLKDYDAKFAEPGSVLWAFEMDTAGGGWKPKFSQPRNLDAEEKLQKLLDELRSHDDVHEVYHN